MENLSVIARYFRVFTEKRLKEFDLTFGEQSIIMFLSKNENVNQEAISKRYMIDKGMVAKTLSKLEEKGFIIREQNPDNKRENLISLTEKGVFILDNIHSTLDEWNDILMKDMSQDEINYLKNLTRKMAKNIANHSD